MKREIWKDVVGYEGLYQVSNYGKIKSFHKRKSFPKMINVYAKRGYYQIGLRKKGKRKFFQVHRLVAEAFVPNPNNFPVVNHKDENKLNNYFENLEWCTVSYNNTYGSRIKNVVNKTGKKVLQYNMQKEFIKEFPSLSEAARSTNTNLSNISACCHGKYKKANNYIWKFKSEVM